MMQLTVEYISVPPLHMAAKGAGSDCLCPRKVQDRLFLFLRRVQAQICKCQRWVQVQNTPMLNKRFKREYLGKRSLGLRVWAQGIPG